MHKLHASAALASLLLWPINSAASPTVDLSSWTAGLPSILWPASSQLEKRQSAGNYEMNPNGTTFLWMIQDIFQGQSFFDKWNFFTGKDPTNGLVNYVDKPTAFSSGLAYVQDDGKAIMRGDDYTWLGPNVHRPSVRISSWAQYNTGLFILDVDKVPWGCGVWPAFWTLGGGTWPYTGEIDIIEGVHDNEHNQVAFHTAPNCTMDSAVNITGKIKTLSNGQLNTDCNGLINDNSGCGVDEWSRASYGPAFDAQGGGVFAMKWDETGISVWSFYRAAVPQDVRDGNPSPSGWGLPVATLSPNNCGPLSSYFVDHSIIFDITFCGDWAGNSYATSGCPGTCVDRLMDPGNFVNATWIINSLKVYRKQLLYGPSYSGAQQTMLFSMQFLAISAIIVLGLML